METNKEQLEWDYRLNHIKDRINEFANLCEFKPQYKQFLHSLLHIMDTNKLYSGSLVLPFHFFVKLFRGLSPDVFKMLESLKEPRIITFTLTEHDIIVSIHEDMYPYCNRDEQIKKDEELARLRANAIIVNDISEYAL